MNQETYHHLRQSIRAHNAGHFVIRPDFWIGQDHIVIAGDFTDNGASCVLTGNPNCLNDDIKTLACCLDIITPEQWAEEL